MRRGRPTFGARFEGGFRAGSGCCFSSSSLQVLDCLFFTITIAMRNNLFWRCPRYDRAVHENRNFTEHVLSARSYARQLAEQMALSKAYVVIAKEHNNLHLAWELNSKLRSCQLLLSKAAKREEPISLDEAEPIIKSLSSLIFKAQDAHYDVATTIMTMKSHIQALEERANAATVQSTLFGELAAESIPKNLQCIDIKLTAYWLQNKSLQKLANERRNSLTSTT